MARGRPRKRQVDPENETFRAETDWPESQNRKSDILLDSLIDRAKHHEGVQKEPEQPIKDDLVTLFEAARGAKRPREHCPAMV